MFTRLLDYYEVLGVTKDATEVHLKKAYRKVFKSDKKSNYVKKITYSITVGCP